LKLAKLFLTEFNQIEMAQQFSGVGVIGNYISMSASSLNVIPEHCKIALLLIKRAAAALLPEALSRLGQIYESGGFEDE
jgi:TPR repeat protein